MKSYITFLRDFVFSPFIHYYMAFSACIVLIASLSSCDMGSKGRYKFQPESMHWLQFRGPNASGIAPENADPPVHFSADTNLLWKTELLPGWSSPCIVNDKIFLTGFDESDSLLYTLAINRENGGILWKDSVTPHNYYSQVPFNSYASPTVSSDGKKVFAYFTNYGLIAYELNGTSCWDIQFNLTFHREAGAISPLVLDSIIIMIINSSSDPKLLALSCLTGDTIWMVGQLEHQGTGSGLDATPVIWNNNIIIHQGGEITGYNLFNGQLVWWLKTPTKGVGTPVIHDDILFLNSWTNLGNPSASSTQPTFDEFVRVYDKNANMKIEKEEISDVDLIMKRPEGSDLPGKSITGSATAIWALFDNNGDGSLEESEWSGIWEYVKATGVHGMLALPLEGSGERPVTDIKWKINEDSPETPSPLIVNEDVMFIKNGGIMTVINQETGIIVHKDRIGAAGSYLSSPMLAGNRIYTCSYNGTVTVLSADDYSVLARNKLEGKIGASPVAIDDVLYIRTDKHLYAFRDQ